MGILRSPFTATHETRWIKQIKDTGDFLEKLKAVEEIPKGAILVTVGVVGLYPSIPDDGGLELLQKQYDKFKDKMVPTKDIIKMADFVLKNNLLEFDSKFYQQISGMAIDCLYWNEVVRNTSYKTLIIEKIHSWYPCYFDRFRGKFKQFPNRS